MLNLVNIRNGWIDNMESNSSFQNKKIVNNIIRVAISNILVVLSSVLVGFLIPKMMSVADYGYYKIFTLYLGYVGLFHFGFCDGIYLIYGGKNYEELDKGKFQTFSKYILLTQIITALIITVISLFFLPSEYGYIFMFVGICLFSTNITTYYQFISQITGRFKELSNRNILKSLLTVLSIILLFILYKSNFISILQYKIYLIIFALINFVLTLWYIHTYRDISFGKSLGFKECKLEIFNFYKVGIPLLVSNLIVNLILSIDRQFVSVLFSNEEYAVYAFAYNMLTMITTAISAISTVLYPTIKSSGENTLKLQYNKLNSIISIFVALCLLSYFPLIWIINWFLPNYVESLLIFRIILPGLIFSTCNSVVIYNYYKSLNMTNKYFGVSIFILVLSIIANILVYSCFGTMESISIASVIVLGLWYFIVDLLIVKKWKINTIKNGLFMVLSTVFFYLITMIESVFIGMILYGLVLVILIVSLYFPLLKEGIKLLKSKLKK